MSVAPAQTAPTMAAQTAKADALTTTITFRQPRVTGKGFIALRKFAKQIAPSRKNDRRPEQVTVDVYINPKADDFTRTAAANMSNEVARKLVGWGVPRDRISRSSEAKQRDETKPGTYDVELNATRAR